MCTSALLTFMYAYDIYIPGACRGQKGALCPLGVKSQMVPRCYVDAEK